MAIGFVTGGAFMFYALVSASQYHGPSPYGYYYLGILLFIAFTGLGYWYSRDEKPHNIFLTFGIISSVLIVIWYYAVLFV